MILKLNKLIKIFLERRGFDEKKLAEIESAEHAPLNHVDRLCERLHEIHENRVPLVILPDFDMDGIMSGTVSYAGFSELGFNVELFIPHPSDGYGFDKHQVIDRLKEKHPDAKVIITCDTGISCAEGTQYANSIGLEVLVTDHHLESEATSARPFASVTVDPCGLDEGYEHPEICGAHVIWQCLDHYVSRYGSDDEKDRIGKLRVFAGVGTISDTMPVLYENRSLIRDSVSICQEVWETSQQFKDFIDGASEPYKRAFRGLWAACKVFSENGKLGTPDTITEDFFGFYLAPTFNAVKRLDADMNRAFGVFFGDHPFDDMRFLFDLNEKRKQLVMEEFAKLSTADNEFAPYCYVSEAPAGVLGLLATKFTDLNSTPCVVVGKNPDGSFSGSGRSPQWYPFNSRASQHGFKVAGHEGAFGCSIPDESTLSELYEFLESEMEEFAEIAAEYEPTCDIYISDGSVEADCGIDQDELLEFVDEVETFRPFGRGFESPVVSLEFDMNQVTWRAIGKEGNHLKFSLPDGMDVLCWNQADYGKDGLLLQDTHVKLNGKMSVNEFRGTRSAQFIGEVVSITPTAETSDQPFGFDVDS